ncbi:MAG TPA: ankyrin repeat domain-containing protein [Legionella sp.]|nr:ankyrin repeat domain-containing protein [Legionella sp.]
MEARIDTSIVNQVGIAETNLKDMPEVALQIIMEHLNLKSTWSLELVCCYLKEFISNTSLMKKKMELERKFPHDFNRIENEFPTFEQISSDKAQKFQQILEKQNFYYYQTEDVVMFSRKNMKQIPEVFRLIRAGDINTLNQMLQIGKNKNTTQNKTLKIDFDDLNDIYKIRDHNNMSLIDWAIKMDMQSLLDIFKGRVSFWVDAMRTESIGVDLGMGQYKNNNPNSWLLWSIILQQPKAKKLLSSKGLPLREKNIYGETPMHLAARNKDLSWLKQLYAIKSLGNEALHDLDNQNNTPWHAAASVGNTDAIYFLLSNGAPLPDGEDQIKELVRLLGTQLNMNHRQQSHITCLHILTEFFEPKWLDYFFNGLLNDLQSEITNIKDKIIPILNKDEQTIKSLTSKLDRLETQFNLLKVHYDNIDQRNPKGLTALQIATRQSNQDKKQILIDNGARIILEKINASCDTAITHNNNYEIKHSVNQKSNSSHKKDNRYVALENLESYIAELKKQCNLSKHSMFQGRNPKDKLTAAENLRDVLLDKKTISELDAYQDILNKGTLKKIMRKANLLYLDKSNHTEVKL